MNGITANTKELITEVTGDGRMFDEARQEKAMAGGSKPLASGSKPLARSKVKNVSQDGARKSGG
jgi:hypothetical protein